MRRAQTWHWLLALIVAALSGLVLLGERGRPLLPSSRKAVRWMGLRHVLDLSIVHAYIYGRWTTPYMRSLRWLLPQLGGRGRRHLAENYHAKVITPEHAHAIVRLDRDVPLRELEQVIPYSRARDLVLTASPDVALFECACRLSRADHCEPTRVCMAVGQPFVDFVLEHHPNDASKVTPEEAVLVLEEEHARGHVHTAWFRTAARGRFYAICNCCPCCCVGMEAMVEHGVGLLASSGFVARIAEAACGGCGACSRSCPFGAITIRDGVAVVDESRCLGCSVCADQCLTGGIVLERDETRPEPLDVRALAEEAAAAR